MCTTVLAIIRAIISQPGENEIVGGVDIPRVVQPMSSINLIGNTRERIPTAPGSASSSGPGVLKVEVSASAATWWL